MKDVKWMSRDKLFEVSEMVDFWSADKPEFIQGEFCCGKAVHLGRASTTLVTNPPAPGECLPVESFEPIRIKVAEPPRYWLFRANDGSYHVSLGTSAPKNVDGVLKLSPGSVWLERNMSEALLVLVCPTTPCLSKGECCEIPPR